MDIRLDFIAPPDEYFKIPVTAKIRETIRALLTFGYPPAEITQVVSQAFPGINFTPEEINHYRYFYWNIDGLMDTSEAQAALYNKLTQIRADILTGKNFLQHIEQLKNAGKKTEIEIIKIFQKNQEIEQNQDLSPEDKQFLYWVPTPYLESDDREQFRRWSEVGSSNPNIPPMVSFNLIIDILSGQIDPIDLALRLGIIPGKYTDVTTVLQNLVPIIALNISKFVKSGDIDSANKYITKVALPISQFLRNLAIPAIASNMSGLNDQINLIYQNSEDFKNINITKGGNSNVAKS